MGRVSLLSFGWRLPAPARRLATATQQLRVCVVGSGPAAFYASKYLLKEAALPAISIDMVERLPTPFGLVRSGVAPDHPEVKAVQNDFEQVATDSRFTFWGNVEAGKDVSLKQLQRMFHVVLLAYGAAGDRMLGIAGEDLAGVLTARAFVNWYNGHPDFAYLTPSLTEALARQDSAVVIGVGNVALDCARILAKGAEGLRGTDIAEHASRAFLDAGRPVGLKNVTVLGRRGHVQAAFTIKELRELTRLDGAKCVVREDELSLGRTEASMQELAQQRPQQRIDKLLGEVALASRDVDPDARRVDLRFLMSPVEVLPEANANGAAVTSSAQRQSNAAAAAAAAGALVAERTRLEGAAGQQRAVGAGEREALPCGLLLESIGYRSLPIPGLPFDERRAVVANEGGRVVGLPGVYCSGWLRRGPSGIIGTNIVDARGVVGAIAKDYSAGLIPGIEEEREGGGGLPRALSDSAAPETPPQPISWGGYLKINLEERRRGALRGKPREKMVAVDEMLEVACTR